MSPTTPSTTPPGSPDDAVTHRPEGGDAVCWLSQVCPDCGALNEGPTGSCWRCGAARTDEEEAGPAGP